MEAPTYFAHPTAVIDDDCVIGNGTKIWHFSHIQKGAKIGTATSGQTNGVDLISIKMQMLSYTKQKIDISTRMNVKSKTVFDKTAGEFRESFRHTW